MKQILTHTSRTALEIISVIEKSGSFTAPLGLPHYRYDNTRRNCQMLTDAGIIKNTGSHEFNRFFAKGDNFSRWVDAGRPKVNDFWRAVIKERKAANPRKPKTKICRGCGSQFETINHAQKSCRKGCK